MGYSGYVKPYENMIQNVQEVVNEWTVLVAAYHLFAFTEWVYDAERRFELGWSLIAVIVINVCFNFIVLACIILKTCLRKTKLKYLKYNHKKMLKKHVAKVTIQRGPLLINLDSIKEQSKEESSSGSQSSSGSDNEAKSGEITPPDGFNVAYVDDVDVINIKPLVLKPQSDQFFGQIRL